MDFAGSRFGEDWLESARGLSARDEAVGLLAHFLVYQVPLRKRPVAHWFEQERDQRLSGTERAWLQAQQAAWLSVWEVRGVEPGRSLKLEDMLTGEVRDVQEVAASKSLAPRQAILARVVDYDGLSLLCGCYARPLPPREAADVVRQARSRLRRKKTDPLVGIRDDKISRYLVGLWDDTVDELCQRPLGLPELRNTDGEALLLTVDRFEFDAPRRAEIEAALKTIEGTEPQGGDGPDEGYLFRHPGDLAEDGRIGTLLASAWIGDGKLRVETNSVERADRVRAQIETACRGRIRHRSREHSDPIAQLGEHGPARTVGEDPPGLSPDEANAVILDFKRRHYADWPDQPLPALGGKTPRTAVRSKAGREQVDLLLKEMESSEGQSPEGQRFDFSELRRELGIQD